MEDKAFWGCTNRYYSCVGTELEVWCVVTFIDDLNLHTDYGVFLFVVDLGGLETHIHRRKTDREREREMLVFSC